MKKFDDKKVNNDGLEKVNGGGTEYSGLPPGANCPICKAVLKDAGATHKYFEKEFIYVMNLTRGKNKPKIINGYRTVARCERCGKVYRYDVYETE